MKPVHILVGLAVSLASWWGEAVAADKKLVLFAGPVSHAPRMHEFLCQLDPNLDIKRN